MHSVRKPPRGLLPIEGAAEVERLGQPRELYRGPAREAALRFPENVNVAAAISLAGLGLDRTTVRIVADPTVVRNTHEIEARGNFGELRVVLQNIPSENPKTGRLTAMSMIKALRNLTAPVVVGM
jgi:aspartate dehydrogenase